MVVALALTACFQGQSKRHTAASEAQKRPGESTVTASDNLGPSTGMSDQLLPEHASSTSDTSGDFGISITRQDR